MNEQKLTELYGEPRRIGKHLCYFIEGRWVTPVQPLEESGNIFFGDDSFIAGKRKDYYQVGLQMTKEEYEKSPLLVAQRIYAGSEDDLVHDQSMKVGERRGLSVISKAGRYDLGWDESVTAVSSDFRYLAIGDRGENDEDTIIPDRIADIKTGNTVAFAPKETGSVEFDKDSYKVYDGEKLVEEKKLESLQITPEEND